ncbi:hypothetical protein RJ639_022923 [Escallonia herrerae]|uniref:Transposase (putative) gypsy type domain-containing protein n=1 Tax=Escallonia herrerae TaxID=1293975 RepID=A0AA89ACT0_9ASTE|nr:hypothetical protein RJ639_022923 [Escallonia herrerae]
MSNKVEEFVSELNVNTQGVRMEPTFDPLFLETGIPLVHFQESRGVPAKEVLRESVQSPNPFDVHTLRSKLSSYDLKLLRERCKILPIVKLRLPDEDESANMTTIDKIGVYCDMFINGIRVPFHPFFVKVLNAYGLVPDQLSPHAWRFMSFFIYQCHRLGLKPRVRVLDGVLPSVQLPNKWSQRGEVCNVWLAECETRACNKLKEENLSETDLEHIKKLKDAEPLESRYPLSVAHLCESGIIYPFEPQDFDDEEEEEEGKNDPGDLPLFNAQGVMEDIIPDELASVHGIGVEEEEMRDLDFGALIFRSQLKRRKVSKRAGSRATSSSIQPDAPHRPAWGISIEESIFKSPCTAWDWSRHAIIPMDRKTLLAYWITDTANGMAMAQVQIGVEKLIAADKVLDEEKKKVMIENNFCREAEKKVGELNKKVKLLELSNSGLTSRNTKLSARVSQLEVKKSTVAHQAVQLFKKSKAFTDQCYRDSKRALVHGYEHKFAREIAAEDILRAEEVERRRAASSRALTSPSISCSLGASGSASGVLSRQQSSVVEGQTHELAMPESTAEQQNE